MMMPDMKANIKEQIIVVKNGILSYLYPRQAYIKFNKFLFFIFMRSGFLLVFFQNKDKIPDKPNIINIKVKQAKFSKKDKEPTVKINKFEENTE